MRCGKVAFLGRVRGIRGSRVTVSACRRASGNWQRGPGRGRGAETRRPSAGRLDDRGGNLVKKQRAPRHANTPIEGRRSQVVRGPKCQRPMGALKSKPTSYETVTVVRYDPSSVWPVKRIRIYLVSWKRRSTCEVEVCSDIVTEQLMPAFFIAQLIGNERSRVKRTDPAYSGSRSSVCLATTSQD